MFGKKDENGAEKRRFWPWGKKDETVAPQPAAENQPETEKPVAPESAIAEGHQPPVAESVEKREPTVDPTPDPPAEQVVRRQGS